jgi:hypothetical protein
LPSAGGDTDWSGPIVYRSVVHRLAPTYADATGGDFLFLTIAAPAPAEWEHEREGEASNSERT